MHTLDPGVHVNLGIFQCNLKSEERFDWLRRESAKLIDAPCFDVSPLVNPERGVAKTELHTC
jgi:hypothetical protein